jgi:hypothetical protein
VGRRCELDTLQAELARAATGEFRTVLLSGEAGVGKTRLAAELLSAAPSDVTGLRARAHALGTTMSFGMWAEAFESHTRRLPPDHVRSLRGGFVGDLGALLRSAAAIGGGTTGEPPRVRLLESLADLLSNIAKAGPVIVLLDDAHLADASSWDVLHYCARNLGSSPVLVIVTARTAELTGQAGPNEVLFDLEQDGQ